METFKDVAVGLRDLIAETVWIAAYDMCVYDQIEQSTLVLEDSLISDDPDNDDNKKCTTDDKERPTCDSCAGTKGICQSVSHRLVALRNMSDAETNAGRSQKLQVRWFNTILYSSG